MRHWILILLLIISVLPCGAAEKKMKSLYREIEFPVSLETPRLSMKDAQKIIPTDFQPGVGSHEVVSRIADRGFQYWYDHSALRDSVVGVAVESAQQKLATQIEVPAQDQEGVDHRISIRFEAFQGLAKLEYHGWLNALINYDAFRAQSEILFNEKIFRDKNLYVNHKINSLESLSTIGVSWSW